MIRKTQKPSKSSIDKLSTPYWVINLSTRNQFSRKCINRDAQNTFHFTESFLKSPFFDWDHSNWFFKCAHVRFPIIFVHIEDGDEVSVSNNYEIREVDNARVYLEVVRNSSVEDNVPFFLPISHLFAWIHAVAVPPEMTTFVVCNLGFVCPTRVNKFEVERLVISLDIDTYFLFVVKFMHQYVIRVKFNSTVLS